MAHFVVVGAGQAGASLVAKLRTLGFDGDITLVGEEPVPPYQRPPLSKKYLLGELAVERLFLRPESFYVEQNIGLKLGARATALDLAKRTVTAGGETLSYDKLALTLGMGPRRLPAEIGGDLAGVHVIRALGHADALAGPFASAKRVLVVGGGYIGLEAAAVAATRGLEVTLVELSPRILARVAAPQTADWFRALHRRHGVDIREGVGLDRLLGEDHVTGARLTDGSEVQADMVIAGVGLDPAIPLAQDAGLRMENGIRVDATCRTSDPHVWAAGDCASFPLEGARLRLESVQNAIDMGECAAANMMDAQTPYMPEPWFWSDQYDVKLQIAGLNTGYTSVVVRPGTTENSRSHWYYAGGHLISVDAMNDPRAYMIGKRLIAAGRSPGPEQVADPATDLKALLA